MKNKLMDGILGLVGGIAGGAAGIYLFGWIAGQGFYALVTPGALAGFLCGFVSSTDSNPRGILNAGVAAGAGLLAEWRSFPFAKNESLGYFLAHVPDLKPITWIMLGLGAFLGFWWGRERIRPGRAKGPTVA